MTRPPTTFLWELTDFLPAWTGLDWTGLSLPSHQRPKQDSSWLQQRFQYFICVDAATGGMSEFKTCKIRNDWVASLADLVLVRGTQSRILSLNSFFLVCFKRSDCIRGKQMKIIL